MKDRFFNLVVLGFTLATTVHLTSSRKSVEKNINFHGYDATGRTFTSTFSNDATLLQYCSVYENVTIITHGWKEYIPTVWVQDMVANFTFIRGGCVFFMDYEYYGQGSYLSLYSNFRSIAQVLTKKLIQLSRLGFDPANFFLFGFSFGAHLVFEAAYKYGPRKVGRVDACDAAGPLFPGISQSALHARDSAMFVQCIHTSGDKGTRGRYCQIDINMGKCGHSQPGSTSRPYLSHGLCPVIYNNAFNVDFKLVPVNVVNEEYNVQCTPRSYTPDVNQLPNSTMGFRLNTRAPLGEYFALTSMNYPFNVL